MTVENLHISPHFAQQIISGHARTNECFVVISQFAFVYMPLLCQFHFVLALDVSSCKVRLGCFVNAIFSSLLLSRRCVWAWV